MDESSLDQVPFLAGWICARTQGGNAVWHTATYIVPAIIVTVFYRFKN